MGFIFLLILIPFNIVFYAVVVFSLGTDFLERHNKIKSYQPFWCWNFLITHEFGQIFSSLALKISCSVKSWGYQTENDIVLDIMAFIWIKLSISTLKGMETLKTPVSNSHLLRSNTSGPKVTWQICCDPWTFRVNLLSSVPD